MKGCATSTTTTATGNQDTKKLVSKRDNRKVENPAVAAYPRMAASGGGNDDGGQAGPSAQPGLGSHSRHGGGGSGGHHHHHHTSRHRRHKHHAFEPSERKLSPFEEKSEHSGSSLGLPPPTKPKPTMVQQLQAEDRKFVAGKEIMLGHFWCRSTKQGHAGLLSKSRTYKLGP